MQCPAGWAPFCIFQWAKHAWTLDCCQLAPRALQHSLMRAGVGSPFHAIPSAAMVCLWTARLVNQERSTQPKRYPLCRELTSLLTLPEKQLRIKTLLGHA